MKHGKVVYTLIYREDGERKAESWVFNGAPTGKKYKAWTDFVASEFKRVIFEDGKDREYLCSSWKGAGKKK